MGNANQQPEPSSEQDPTAPGAAPFKRLGRIGVNTGTGQAEVELVNSDETPTTELDTVDPSEPISNPTEAKSKKFNPLDYYVGQKGLEENPGIIPGTE